MGPSIRCRGLALRPQLLQTSLPQTALLLSSLLLSSACAVPESGGEPGFVDLVRDDKPAPRPWTEAGTRLSAIEARSIDGRMLRARLMGDQGPCLLFLGAIHGDEPLLEVAEQGGRAWLVAHPIETRGLRLVFCSPINPDGLERGTRRNARGIDLNRNFPASNFRPSPHRGKAPLSEPESRFVARLLETYKPQLVITVHQPRRSVNWDGPAEDLARAMARLNGYRPEASVGYSTPGSLGSWVGIDQGIPILTLELPRRPGPQGSFLAENLPALILAMASFRGSPGPRSKTSPSKTVGSPKEASTSTRISQ